MSVPRRPRFAAAIAILLLVGCALRAPQTPHGVRTELFFGRALPGGAVVDDTAWAAFLADVVTPRFPRGFTVFDASGQYRDEVDREVTRERTAVLVVVHDAGPGVEAAIREVIEEYKRRFAQRSVLRVDTRADVSF